MFGPMKIWFRQGGFALAAALALCATAAGLGAQQPAPGGQRTPGAPAGQGTPGAPAGQATPAGPAAPTKPYVPLTASTLATKPAAYVGEFVTVTATVDQVLGKTAFSIDQDKAASTGKDVLVLPRRLNGPVEANTYVTVIGEVMMFDPAKLAARAKEFPMDLPPDAASKFQGKAVVLATSVINPAMTDLAKWLAPPMTPAEEALDKAMKAVGAANGAMRKGLAGSNAELVKTNTEALAKAFTEAEAFFKQRKNMDAVKWAQDARGVAAAIEKSAVAGNWTEVKTSADNLGKMCQTCHAEYRLRGEDGTFYLKPADAPKSGQ